jgi:hypothetical protein
LETQLKESWLVHDSNPRLYRSTTVATIFFQLFWLRRPQGCSTSSQEAKEFVAFEEPAFCKDSNDRVLSLQPCNNFEKGHCKTMQKSKQPTFHWNLEEPKFHFLGKANQVGSIYALHMAHKTVVGRKG